MAPVPNGAGIEIDNNHLQYNEENISFDKPTTLPSPGHWYIFTDLHTSDIFLVNNKTLLNN